MTLVKLHFIEGRNSSLFPLVEWCEYEHFMLYSIIVLKFEEERFLDLKQGHKDNSVFGVLRVMSSVFPLMKGLIDCDLIPWT